MHNKYKLHLEELLKARAKKEIDSDGEFKLYSAGECYKIYLPPVRNIKTGEIINTDVKLFKFKQLDGSYIIDEDIYEAML